MSNIPRFLFQSDKIGDGLAGTVKASDFLKSFVLIEGRAAIPTAARIAALA